MAQREGLPHQKPLTVDDSRVTQLYVQQLTNREREVAELAADGLSNEAIGRQLFIAKSGVARHLTEVYEEMGTLEEFAGIKPSRYLLIRVFAPFFERHPSLRIRSAS